MYSKPFIAEIQDHIQRLIDKHEAEKENRQYDDMKQLRYETSEKTAER
jgi:hypothetical protein